MTHKEAKKIIVNLVNDRLEMLGKNIPSKFHELTETEKEFYDLEDAKELILDKLIFTDNSTETGRWIAYTCTAAEPDDGGKYWEFKDYKCSVCGYMLGHQAIPTKCPCCDSIMEERYW